ncbi:MAG TPA: J domain-containing protein [Acidimicrobiales bacterium]|nr:J domain-containing protein [Acidimicrobiales bacterium]
MQASAEDYELLGLRPGATSDEIKAAYRRLARQVHPDSGGSSPLFRQVKDAYDRLMAATAGPADGPGARPAGGGTARGWKPPKAPPDPDPAPGAGRRSGSSQAKTDTGPGRVYEPAPPAAAAASVAGGGLRRAARLVLLGGSWPASEFGVGVGLAMWAGLALWAWLHVHPQLLRDAAMAAPGVVVVARTLALPVRAGR